VSETAAANGINALARSLGTAISSAVVGAILAGMTVSFAGRDIPSLAGLRLALVVAAGAAGLAALLTLLIPKATAVDASLTELEPVLDAPQPQHSLERSAFLMCDHIEESGDVTLGQLADQFEIDVPTASRHVAALLREGLATGTGRGDTLSFSLTTRGRDRLYQERAHGLRQN
jgi:DNA-binding MarR family transcriptional regulator